MDMGTVLRDCGLVLLGCGKDGLRHAGGLAEGRSAGRKRLGA